MPLTEYQELAASSRGGSRLVSAAAGSGKTKVLVERLMRYVDDGRDIDEFLVVTYTRAAAGELRGRILSELNGRLAAAPEDRRLRRQTELCCRAAIGTIDSVRSGLGAVQNRLTTTVDNLTNIQKNSTAARSTVQDVDFASETAELTKQQTLQSASTAILSQANQLPSAVLKLLQ